MSLLCGPPTGLLQHIHYYYSPKTKHIRANYENNLWGKNAVFTRSAITPMKVNTLDGIWSTMSTLLGTGPGRFWGPSAQ